MKYWWLLAFIACLPLSAGDSKLAAPFDIPAEWSQPTEPFKIGGPLYYVGTKGLAVYLFKSSAGLILLNGALPQSADAIAESIRKLGFKVEDIKKIVFSHAHFDHVGTLGHLKKLSGAPVYAMAPEVELLKSGGKTDYLFADNPKLHFDPVKADHILQDKQRVELGDVTLIAHWTPGHTPGCTTWETRFEDQGRSYKVVFLDGTGINPGTRFVNNPSYPTIAKDYRRTFDVLRSLKPDIFLAYHAELFALERKRERAVKDGARAWVDPQGYRDVVSKKREAFDLAVAQEKAQK